jgi:hypothetical protein
LAGSDLAGDLEVVSEEFDVDREALLIGFASG